MIKQRSSGILLHITSLPSLYGIGDLGVGAYQFADFLAEAGQSFWQVLPLNPIELAFGNSPYSSYSAFAGNVVLISPELLFSDGLLSREDIRLEVAFPERCCDYHHVVPYKIKLLNCAYERFKHRKKQEEQFLGFCSVNSYWLEDYAAFVVLKRHYNGRVWGDWGKEISEREPESLKAVRERFKDEIEKEKFFQYIFYDQWHRLKKYCNEKGIKFIGDMPIYVGYDSVDVWENSGIFKLDENKKPTHIAGVPPDYFSQHGQLWGNPVYCWEALKEKGHYWWLQRMEHSLNLFDMVRIDHFRGFVSYWEVPATEKTAVAGYWVKVPAEDFFTAIVRKFPNLSIIAEDLGVITDDVKEIMRKFGFPGMRVLLFAFGEDNPHHPYLPENFVPNCVVYTGTHDNNTARGWFESEASEVEKQRLSRYLGREILSGEVHEEFMRLAMESIANLVIIPMQDVLGLGAEARMNHPGKPSGNWEWRLLPEEINSSLAKRLLQLTESSHRKAFRICGGAGGKTLPQGR